MRILSVTGHAPGHGFAERRGKFWLRQLAPEVSKPRIIFDILFGIVGPILCFVFDPIVFRRGWAGGALFPTYQLYVYLFSGLQIVLISLWLLSGTGFRSINDTIGAGLICGGVFCAVVGFVLLPFTLIGLGFGIGLFGFIPFLTAIAYWRNGIRAIRERRTAVSLIARSPALLSGCFIVIGAPTILGITIHSAVKSSIDEMIQGDPSHATAAAHRLSPLKYFVGSESERLVEAYRSTADPGRKQFLKTCYQEITGEKIEDHFRVVTD